jgi:hypothetical protein
MLYDSDAEFSEDLPHDFIDEYMALMDLQAAK